VKRHFGTLGLLACCFAAFSCSGTDREPGGRGPIDNVLLISIDTLRADRVGCYGYAGRTTPAIDALAAEGVVFRHAVSPVPLTLPAHASMLTGANPPRHGVRGNATYRLGPDNVTLAEILADNGFTTGAVISAFVVDSRFGLDQGFDDYDDAFDEPVTTNVIVERSAGETTRHALQWIEENRQERFFMFLHYFDPHLLHDPPEPYASEFFDDPYDGEIAYVDAGVGEVIDALKRLDLFDRTLVVVTADHGEMLGEHGELSHGWFVYESAIRVPLIFRAPGIDPGVRDEPAGLIDIVPTICALLELPCPEGIDGVDLAPILRGGGELAARELYCESLEPTKYGCNPLLALVGERHKYIETTRPEMYDLHDDPQESRNLLMQEPERGAASRERLASLLAEQGRGRSDASTSLDEDSQRRIEALGYVGASGDTETLLEPGRDDPKDLIDFHSWALTIPELIARGDLEEARRRGELLVVERPGFADGYLLLARIARDQRRPEEAIRHYEQALEAGARRADVLGDLGSVLVSVGRADEAMARYREALEIDPGHVESHNNLGNALLSAGRVAEALPHYQRALESRPDSAETHLNAAIAYLRLGRTGTAIDHLSRSVATRPDARAEHTLGRALLLEGRAAPALEAFGRAHRLDRAWPPPVNDALWLLSAHPDASVRDPERAVLLAEGTVDLAGIDDAGTLDARASVYASAGRYGEAVRLARSAVDAATAAGMPVEPIRSRLTLYEEGRPYVASDAGRGLLPY